jgi:hypothetical protein
MTTTNIFTGKVIEIVKDTKVANMHRIIIDCDGIAEVTAYTTQIVKDIKVANMHRIIIDCDGIAEVTAYTTQDVSGLDIGDRIALESDQTDNFIMQNARFYIARKAKQ